MLAWQHVISVRNYSVFSILSLQKQCFFFKPQYGLAIFQMLNRHAVILEPRKRKSDTVSTVSPSISHEVGLGKNKPTSPGLKEVK